MRHSIFAMALVLAGCSSVGDLRRDAKAPAAVPSADAVQAAQLNSYINAMSQLVQGSPPVTRRGPGPAPCAMG
jgi:hypothetical protein